MKTDTYMKRFIGTMVILSSILTYIHHRYWVFFTLFIGLNVLQWSFTGFCPAEKMIRKILKE